MPSNTASNWVLSCRWPAVSCTLNGRPRPSKARCSFEVKPPRLRPRASPSLAPSPFFRAFGPVGLGAAVAGTGRVLVRPDAGAVDRHDLPVQFATLIRVPLQGLEDPFPQSLAFPAGQSLVARALRPIPGGQIFPLGPGAQDPEDPINHLAVIPPSATALPLGAGQQGRDPLPFLIRQVSSCHSGAYLPTWARFRRIRPNAAPAADPAPVVPEGRLNLAQAFMPGK
jgi:hypothetical protein